MAAKRSNSPRFRYTASWWAEKAGESRVSSSRISSEASAETRVKKDAAARCSSCPERSMASAVFSKVAGSGSSTMAWISARCSARPASTASE